jgi:hypothetical protein
MAWQAKNFEEKMHPYIDEIYKGLFSSLSRIERSNRETTTDSKILFMDKELSIDTFLYFKDGTVLTLQEKSRKHNYLKYDDFTFEYYNDPKTKDEGEWFKLAAQLYFYGFTNESETGYAKFYLLNVPKLRLFLKNNIGIKALEEKYLHPNRPPAKANFFAIPFSIIPDYCIMYKSQQNVA